MLAVTADCFLDDGGDQERRGARGLFIMASLSLFPLANAHAYTRVSSSSRGPPTGPRPLGWRGGGGISLSQFLVPGGGTGTHTGLLLLSSSSPSPSSSATFPCPRPRASVVGQDCEIKHGENEATPRPDCVRNRMREREKDGAAAPRLGAPSWHSAPGPEHDATDVLCNVVDLVTQLQRAYTMGPRPESVHARRGALGVCVCARRTTRE
jgi:hypothetical protein